MDFFKEKGQFMFVFGVGQSKGCILDDGLCGLAIEGS